jgi:hypothetical protein
MSEKVIRAITIKAEGELGLTPAVSSLLQSCVKMNSEHGRETGDFYFQDLRVQYSYAEHKVTHVKHGGKRKKEQKEACHGDGVGNKN